MGCCEDCLTCDIAFNAVMPLSHASTRARYSRIEGVTATMGMPNVRYAPEPNVSPNAKLTLFFEGVLGALEQFRSNRATSLANEARKLCWGALTKVLTKVAYWNPNLDFDAALESLPEDADLATLEERIKTIISRIDGIQRVEGLHRD